MVADGALGDPFSAEISHRIRARGVSEGIGCTPNAPLQKAGAGSRRRSTARRPLTVPDGRLTVKIPVTGCSPTWLTEQTLTDLALANQPMLAKRIIPCLDVDCGRVVKGTNFVQLRDAGDPVEVAARYEQEGADELVFLDITASHEGRDIMLDVVRRTAEQVFMPLTVGGGIRTLDDIRALLMPAATKSRSIRLLVAIPRSFARRRAVWQSVHRGQH